MSRLVKVPPAVEPTPSLIETPLPQMVRVPSLYSLSALRSISLELRSSRGLDVIESLPSGSRYCISPEHGSGLFSVIKTVSRGQVSSVQPITKVSQKP